MRSPSTTARQSCLRAGNPTAGRGDHRLQHAEMSGYALSRIINEHYPSVTVFGMTADARESVRDEAREAGMRDCIFKPVTLVALENLLAPLAPSVNRRLLRHVPSRSPALLDGEHLATFLDLQITVLEETLGDIALWRKDPGTPLKDALHRLRGGIQLLGMPALEARCGAGAGCRQRRHPSARRRFRH